MNIFKLIAQIDTKNNQQPLQSQAQKTDYCFLLWQHCFQNLDKPNQLNSRHRFAIKLFTSTILLLGTFFADSSHAKEPFEAYTTSLQSATSSSYTGANDGRTYTFGNGNDLNLESITANGGIIYTPKELADQIFIRRVDNAQVSGERCNIFVERTTSRAGDINSNSTFPVENNDCSIVEVLRDLVVNRGVLDVFSNAAPSGSEIPNNIERVDFVFTQGIKASPIVAELDEAGHIVMEKSGNNPVKVAAITAIDGAGNPTAFSDTVVTINTSDYGITGSNINNNFLVDASTTGGVTNPEFTRQSNEKIGGVLVTLADFGIGTGETYYGFAMFGTDVDNNTVDLLQPNTFPSNTPHGVGATGGADWQGGMGGFWSSPQYSTVVFSDYGDAPTSYDNGDSGEHLTINSSGLYLGTAAPDAETAPQSSTNADGDDNNGDDEDGISSFPVLDTDDTSYSLTATVNNSSSSAANVYAWIDFDLDGEFDEDEKATVADGTISLVSDQVPSGSSGTVTLNWSNIGSTGADITNGDSYVRLRLATNDLDITTETTERDDASVVVASNGEVEDYQIAIADTSTSLCPTARADLWFANDESGSVNSTEFADSLDFIYQVSDQFEYGETAGIKAGIIGWASNIPSSSNHIIIPITDTFGDSGDSGLIADSNITTDGDNQGVREQYTAKVVSSSGTRLDRASSYLADLIIAGTTTGGRAATPQIAIILTDANLSQITNSSSGGGFNWISAAEKLKVDAGATIVLIIIDDAADAYNTNTTAQQTIDTVVGDNGRLLIVPTYTEAADATNEYITLAAQAVCDSTTPVATDPELLLTKRITAINPGQDDEVYFTDFVDDDSDLDNNSKWPNSLEGSGTFTNTYTVGQTDGGQVVPEDVVEYTIYFLSSGSQTAQNVLVCDLIPENMEFTSQSFNSETPASGGLPGAARGILWQYNDNIESMTNGTDGDSGYYFPPGVEPSSVFPNIVCDSAASSNTNGAVVVNLGNLPGATDPGIPTNSYGFIRFRAKVK